jgi:hypothetical protein
MRKYVEKHAFFSEEELRAQEAGMPQQRPTRNESNLRGPQDCSDGKEPARHNGSTKEATV